MGRISREVMFMEMARAASKRSTCFRLNVGAIVTQGNNPIAVGWNGQQHGEAHCPGNSCPGIVPGNCNTIHAEVNALTKAGQIVFGNNAAAENVQVDLYCTDSPCPYCVGFILENTGLTVSRIFYEKPYRLAGHLDRLIGVSQVYLVTPAGYIVDHFTNRVAELP